MLVLIAPIFKTTRPLPSTEIITIPHDLTSTLLLQSLPLLGGIALGSPRVDSSNLSLKDRVDKTVTRKHILALKLGRNDHGLERLTTTTYRSKSLG
jgi:hypothetical protein